MKKVVRFILLTALFTAIFAMTAFAAKGDAKAAFAKVNEIVGSFSHTRPDGRPWYTADDKVLYGENLAQYYDSAEEVVAAWMNSPSHRANILKGDFKSGAIFTVEVDGEVYWAEEFGI